ncbi:hypothetical protein IWQ56_000442 [Coemansia nantahalensis]|nr:hypothetical protein IWQ56_000442 [Coemansia nantahalensis]
MQCPDGPDPSRHDRVGSESGGDSGSEMYSDLGDIDGEGIWLDIEDEAAKDVVLSERASVPQLDGAGDDMRGPEALHDIWHHRASDK